MKKTLTLVAAIALVLSILLCVGCSNPKKEEAINAFNKASTAFDEVANLINANQDKINAADAELIPTMQEMSKLLTEYKEKLEGDEEYTDESYDAMIEWFGTVEEWAKESKTELNKIL